MTWGLIIGLIAVMACPSSAVFASTILIDDFTQPDPCSLFMLGSGNSPSKQLTQASTGAIGGERDSTFKVMGVGQPNSALGLLGFDTAYGMNALQLATNGFSPTVTTLEYGASRSLGVDLTGGGTNNSFLLDFYSSDAQPTGGLGLAITITSPGGSSTATWNIGNSLSEFNVVVPFSQLVGNASLSDVSTITYVLNGANPTPNIDYEIHSLAVVPEPASGLLMALAAVSWGCVVTQLRRRKLPVMSSN